jgi:hypothetical protein
MFRKHFDKLNVTNTQHDACARIILSSACPELAEGSKGDKVRP